MIKHTKWFISLSISFPSPIVVFYELVLDGLSHGGRLSFQRYDFLFLMKKFIFLITVGVWASLLTPLLISWNIEANS